MALPLVRGWRVTWKWHLVSNVSQSLPTNADLPPTQTNLPGSRCKLFLLWSYQHCKLLPKWPQGDWAQWASFGPKCWMSRVWTQTSLSGSWLLVESNFFSISTFFCNWKKSHRTALESGISVTPHTSLLVKVPIEIFGFIFTCNALVSWLVSPLYLAGLPPNWPQSDHNNHWASSGPDSGQDMDKVNTDYHVWLERYTCC